MSIKSLEQQNNYDIYVNSINITGTPNTNSFRKGKSNIQSVTPSDPTPSIISFDTFIDQPFIYLDNEPNNCFEFIDDNNIKINKTGKYLVFLQLGAGNETPGSTMIVGVNLQGTLLMQSISLVVQGGILLPINNGLHTQNMVVVMSSIAQLNQNDVLQAQYIVSANTDIYPSSCFSLKYLSS